MINVIEGRVHRLKHNIDIDQIYPREHLDLTDPEAMADHLFGGYGHQPPIKIKPGDILVAGKCFGWGPYRCQALTALRHAGVGCIVAASYGRQFYRSALNIGIPAITIPEARDKVKDGEQISIDFDKGEFRVKKEVFKFETLPFPLKEIVAAGGLFAYLKAGSGKIY